LAEELRKLRAVGPASYPSALTEELSKVTAVRRGSFPSALAEELRKLTAVGPVSFPSASASSQDEQDDRPSALDSLVCAWMDERGWVPLPPDAPPRFSELVLIRQIPATFGGGSLDATYPQVRDLGDPSEGYAIVRHSLGKGRSRGWLFQRARIRRLNTETLPPWLTRC
jgi:hypothetical protein